MPRLSCCKRAFAAIDAVSDCDSRTSVFRRQRAVAAGDCGAGGLAGLLDAALSDCGAGAWLVCWMRRSMSEGKLPSAMTALRDEDRPVMKWFMTSIRSTLTVAALRV